jgi:hypothetical protein
MSSSSVSLEHPLIRKPVNDLNFLNAKEAMSTVEIDVDSLPEGSFGYAQLTEWVLAPLAAANPDLRATVYVYEGPSVNFGNYGHSAFFGVAGDRRVLGALYASFRDTPRLNVRHSDQIRQSQSIRQYHLEDGVFWPPEEEGVWYAGADDEDDESPDGRVEGEDKGTLPDDEWGVDDDAADGCPETGGDAEAAPPAQPLRFRAAQSDASVGSIARSIEAVYGLPEGAVALRGPDRKVLRSDATIRTLRRRWE